MDFDYAAGVNPPNAYLYRDIPTTASCFEMGIVYRAEEDNSSASATYNQTCRITVFGDGTFYYSFRVADDQQRIVQRSGAHPTPWTYYSQATFACRIPYVQRLIVASNIRLYTQNIWTGYHPITGTMMIE